MNDPQKQPTPREEREIRLTALLMGELPPEEAAALEAQVAADPALAALQTRLAKALELLREASQEPEAPASPTPVQLSAERRTRLLAHFKTVRPTPPKTVKLAKFPRSAQVTEKKERDWSWLIPLGVAATVVGLVAYGLGGTVFTRTVADTPDFSASSSMVNVTMEPGALAADDEHHAHSYAMKAPPPPPPLAPNMTNFASLSSSTPLLTASNGPTATSMFRRSASVRALTTPAPASAPVTIMAGGTLNATSGSVLTAPASRRKDGLDRDAVPAAGGAGAAQSGRSTIYLGSGTANSTAITAANADKRGFDTDVNGYADGLVKMDSGSLVLSGANTYAGGTVLNSGTVTLGNGNSNTTPARPLSDQSQIIGSISGAGSTFTGIGVVADPHFSGSFFDGRTSAMKDSGTLTANNSDVVTLGGVVSEGKPVDSLEFKTAQSKAVAGREVTVSTAPRDQIALNLFGIPHLQPNEFPIRVEQPAASAQPAGQPIESTSPPQLPAAAAKSAPVASAAPSPERELVKEMAEKSKERNAAVVAMDGTKTKSEARIDYGKPINPKHQGSEEAKRLFIEAQGLYDTGRFLLAKKRAEQILQIDPENIAARRFEEKTDRAMSDYGIAAYNETRADAIAKTDMAWARPVRRSNHPEEIVVENTSPKANTDRISKKLNSIIIPKVEFHDTTVREAIDFLKKKSVELDAKSPAGEKGTNIVLKLGEANAKDVPGLPGLEAPAKDTTPAEPDETNPANARITVSLKDVPLGEALKYVTGLANLNYKVEPYAISVFPLSQNADPLLTQEWKVPADLIPNVNEANGIADRTAAKNWLLSQGLSFNGAASAVYLSRTNRLIVRNTQEQLDRIGEIIETKTAEKADAEAKPAPSALPVPQPEVETRANAFSTFSLNVSDVSFKLAAASLEENHMPDPATVRSEEFINAFDYRDPEPAPGAPLAFVTERARYPFAQNRDLLRFSVKTAAAGRQPGRPLNIVLLLDSSGSMERADRVNIVREALRVLAAQLQPQDKLSIVTFARTPHLWADGVAGDKVADTIARVGQITPEGGTNLEAALDLGYATALKHYSLGSISRVVLFTDGAANLGDVDPEALTKKVEAQRKKGVALDCFGIGWEGFNDDLLEQLTRNADGRYGFINTPEEAAENFAAQLAGALRVTASDVKVQVEFNPRRVMAYRQVGYAKHQLTKEQFRDNTVNAAQIGAAESGNALYVVEVDPRGEGDLATVRVRFRDPGTSDYHEREWAVPFTGDAQPLEKASSALRLAGAASAFSEMLANNPYAAEVTSDRLLNILSGVPPIYGNDPRPTKLEWMIRQARSLSNR